MVKATIEPWVCVNDGWIGEGAVAALRKEYSHPIPNEAVRVQA